MTRVLTHQEGFITIKATGVIPMGKPVTLAGVVAIGNDYVGIAMWDDAIAADNEAESYAIGEEVNVKLRGPIEDLEAGGVFVKGDFVKFGTAGKVVEETDGAVMTLDTIGLAFEAGADSAYAKIVRFL